MNKLGSEFIEDFEKDEKTIFGVTYRILLLLASILSFIAIMTLTMIFELPEIIYQVYMCIVVIPSVFFGASMDRKLKIKERTHYFFLIKRRVYQTELKNKEKGDT